MEKLYEFTCLLTFTWPIIQNGSNAADHNDPNAVNSIFSDIAMQATDLYGMFGYPIDDKTAGEKVVMQLTFPPVPATGVFDRDILYTINIDPDPRLGVSMEENSIY